MLLAVLRTMPRAVLPAWSTEDDPPRRSFTNAGESIALTSNLHIFSSHRIEDLWEVLSRTLEESATDPLAAQTIVVPSQGLARWLQLRWATRWGVAAGFEYLFPGQWARRLGSRLGLDPRAGAEAVAAEDPFDTPALALRVFEMLGDLASSHEGLRAYLGDDPAQRRRLQLATLLARYFGEWQLFRPDVLRDWEAGRRSEALAGAYRHEPWVQSLWQRLCEDDLVAVPLGRLLLDLGDRLRAPQAEDQRLLEPVHVFGVSSIPPLLLRLLHGVSQLRPVSIYFPAPTRSYWSGVRSERQLQRDELREPQASYDIDESIPSLLANLGQQGREFFSMLQDLDEDGSAWQAVGESLDRSPTSVLESVQADIRGGQVDDVATVIDPTRDRSLRLHSCHSPRRELEVLRDSLWRAFADDRSLEPGDVLVLVSDMRRYAPFIRTVFDERVEAVPRIPYALADRRWEDEEPLVRAFLRLLELGRSRHSSLQLLDLLETPAIARRFAMDESHLADARELVRELGIRWGSDPAQRARDWEVPQFGGASWREGLDEALFGMLSGEVDDAIAGVRPAGDLAPARLEVSARLSVFLREVTTLWESMREPVPLSDWCARLVDALPRFFDASPDGEVEVLAMIRRSLEDVSRLARECHLEEPWSAESFLAILRERLEAHAPAMGFLSGAVTFAELRPLRSVPFRFVAILGLDQDVFPRLLPRDSLDLLALERRRGDRGVKEDDRYLFLETLMAAREVLHLSAVAKSQGDGSDRGRSIVLQELHDALHRRWGAAAMALDLRHRLHSFHRDYFTAEAQLERSFDVGAAQAANVAARSREAIPEFWRGGGLAREVPVELDFDDLLSFWRDPGKWFCRSVLGVWLREMGEAEEGETLALDGLGRWRVRQAILDAQQFPLSSAEEWSLERRLGLPRTASSQLLLDSAAREGEAVREWWESLDHLADQDFRTSLTLPDHGAVELRGRLRGWTRQGLASASASKLGLGDEIGALLRLAVGCHTGSQPAGEPAEARHRGSDVALHLIAKSNDSNSLETWLQKVVELYLGAHRRPLYLNLRLAKGLRERVEKLGDLTVVDESLVRDYLAGSKGSVAWQGTDRAPGVVADEAWSLLLGPRLDPGRVIADLASTYDEVVRPLRQFRAENGEVGA